MAGRGRNWVDRTRPLWRVGNRLEALQLRKLGTSPMAMLIHRGDFLVIETTGRISGRRRFTPIGYWRQGDRDFLVGGGAAGMSRTPDWVANLRNEPRAAIWVDRTRIAIMADELFGDERDEAQRHAVSIWPSVDRYERLSGRVIPYFRLTASQ